MAVAFFLSGLVISRFQPRAWVLAVYDVMVGLVFVGGLLFFAFWGCNTKAIQGVNQIGGQYQYAPPPPNYVHDSFRPDRPRRFCHRIDINTDCNSACHCSPNRFAPVCSSDGQTNYFSACHSGCHSMRKVDGKKVKKTIEMPYPPEEEIRNIVLQEPLLIF